MLTIDLSCSGSNPVNQNGFPVQGSDVSAPFVQDQMISGPQNFMTLPTLPEVNYMSHWLEAGFDPEDIPNSLY